MNELENVPVNTVLNDINFWINIVISGLAFFLIFVVTGVKNNVEKLFKKTDAHGEDISSLKTDIKNLRDEIFRGK